MKRKLCMTLAMFMALSNLTGCAYSSELAAVQALDRQPFRSMQQVMDTNKEGLKYTSFSQRTAVGDYKASYNQVSAEQQAKCMDLLSVVLGELNKNVDYDTSIVDPEQHDYWKNLLDDYILENPMGQRIREFSGYYFLTVNFAVRPNTTGNFLAAANYVGFDNCFKHDENEEPILNNTWITYAFDEINAQREALELPVYKTFMSADTTQVYTQETEEVTLPEETEDDLLDEDDELLGDGEEASTEETFEEGTEDGTEPAVQETRSTTSVEDNSQDVYTPENKVMESSDTFNGNLRRLEYDIEEYEDILGSSQDSVAFMPYLSQVYQSAPATGALSGDGCYNEGISGMRDFGFNRDDMQSWTTQQDGQNVSLDCTGSASITFVFKQDELDKDELNFVLAYLENYTSFNPFIENTGHNYISLPTFIENQIKIKVEELDRLTNNGDVNGLMRMDTIEDAGLALKLAQYRNSADITTYATDVKGCLARHGNVYLVEVERTIADTPKNTGYVAQYKEKAYVVVRQKDVDFYINDVFTASRELTRQPEIHEISQQYKQLVNLNLADVVTDEIQQAICRTVLNDWSYYTNQRILGGDEKSADDYGMYGQFNSNRSTLPEDRLEYINSKMRNLVIAKGVGTKANLNIIPVEWVGGTNQQVELITKEFIQYGDNTGHYMECYYLLSHFGNRWVIDDIQVFNERDSSGQDYQKVLSDFSGDNVIRGLKASNDKTTEVLGEVQQ